MSLRPRYSLLTLLLLTAAVAGGIKYWHGPHRAELGNPPTQAETAVLERYFHLRDFINTSAAEAVRYRYTRGFDEISWDLIEGRNFIRPLLISVSPQRLVSGYPWTLPLKNGWQTIAYWVADVGPNNCPRQTEKPTEPQPPFSIYGMEETCCIYLLSEEQQLYRLGFASDNGDALQAIELSQVTNDSVRERLAAELATLKERSKVNPPKP